MFLIINKGCNRLGLRDPNIIQGIFSLIKTPISLNLGFEVTRGNKCRLLFHSWFPLSNTSTKSIKVWYSKAQEGVSVAEGPSGFETLVFGGWVLLLLWGFVGSRSFIFSQCASLALSPQPLNSNP